MDYLFLKICICCSCSAWVWMNLLTRPQGLLEFVKVYYPKRLQRATCAMCFSGWLSIIAVSQVFLWTYNVLNPWVYVYIFFAPIITMTITRIILK